MATLASIYITCLVVITVTGDTTENEEKNSVVNAEVAPTPIVIYIQQSSPLSNQQGPPNQPYYQQFTIIPTVLPIIHTFEYLSYSLWPQEHARLNIA